MFFWCFIAENYGGVRKTMAKVCVPLCFQRWWSLAELPPSFTIWCSLSYLSSLTITYTFSRHIHLYVIYEQKSRKNRFIK